MTNEQITQKWDEIVELFGPQAVLDELFSYMSLTEKEEFLEHLNRMWDLDYFDDDEDNEDDDDDNL
jgi:hypothetical protein